MHLPKRNTRFDTIDIDFMMNNTYSVHHVVSRRSHVVGIFTLTISHDYRIVRNSVRPLLFNYNNNATNHLQ
jgi:hypothetical protein